MQYTLYIPDIGDVKEVRMLEWHGEAGTSFNEGDLIAELETHKVVIEVRAGQAGVLRKRLVEEGAWQKTMQPIAVLTTSPDDEVVQVDADENDFAAEFMVA